MANEDISYDVIVDFILRNAASSQAQIQKYSDALETLSRDAGEVQGKFGAAEKALDRMAQGFQSGLGGVRRYGKGFEQLTAQLQTAQKEFARFAQSSAAMGSKNPTSAATNLSGLDLKTAQKYVAINEAANASVLQQSQKIIAAKKAEEAAAVKSAREQVKATQRMEQATEKRISAEQQYSREQKRNTNTELSREWDAQYKALENVHQVADTAADSSLPRLRYALYDVSSTLTVAGAAMLGFAAATVGLSVTMDRQFADVLRTTETYLDGTGEAALRMRDEFNELFATLPSSWGDLTDIGALAGQLNIASDNVAEFTRLVAQFAATTDASIEDSATAFGRLSQLLDVPASEFQNLGSSILAVGVNSVATESQIIAISTQITAMASSAGFTADQVFGLSSALASLGTRPELSRGVITRLFSNINSAIDTGSEKLDKFGAALGTTGQEFAQAWGSDASGTLLRLMEGIGAKEGPAAVSALNDLGIVAARDVPTLLRLAQNSDVLADSLATAAQGYAEGSALSDQYGVIALTVAERLKVLWNNVQLLFTAFGDTQSVLGPVIDGLTGLVKAFTAIANNPVGQVLSLVAISAIALGGALALAVGAATRGAAGFIALRTALVEMNAISATSAISLRGIIAGLTGTTAAASGAAGSVRGMVMSLVGLEAGAGAAANGMKVLNGVFKATLAGAAIAGGLFLITKAVEGIGKAMRSNKQIAEDYLGDLTGFQEAVSMDSASDYSGRVFGEIAKEAPKAATATDGARQSTEAWLGIQRQVPGEVDGATDALSDQNFVLGENAEAWLKNALAQDEAFQDFVSNPANRAAMEKVGVDMQDFIAQGLAGGDSLDAAVAEINERITTSLKEDGPDPALGDLWREINQGLAPAFEGLYDTLDTNVAVNEALGTSAEEAADGLGDMGDAASDALSDFFDLENGMIGVQNSLFDLGEGLRENGADFDIFSAAGRDNMESLLGTIQAVTDEAGGNTAQAAANLQLLFDYIVAGGYASAEQLGTLSKAIETLKGELKPGTEIPTATLQIDSFFGGWESGAEKARKETKKAKEEIITISDYAKDLASVWTRAFDIRFGAEESLDGITTAFQGLRDEAAASAERVQGLKDDVKDLKSEILSLNSDIKGLQSDRALQEYFLGVANQYGDTQRAKAIKEQIRQLDEEIRQKRGEVSERQGEIAEATKEAEEETKSQSKALTGNSAEAIKNRAAIRDLVSQYQSHIEALANSGLSEEQLRAQTEQLRNDFINQATQLGYNRDELGMYAAAFNDVRTAIDNVPRNVNVTANVDPAIQSLNEFEAKARSAAESAAESIATGGGRGYNVPEITLPVKAEIQSMAYGSAASREAGFKIPNTPIFVEPGYANGGFTGRGGKHDPAGVVHRGEYVVPKHQVNQSTGLPYADALGRLSRGSEGRTGYAAGGYVSGGGFGGNVVVGSFGPMAQQQLMTSQQTFVSLSSRQLADSTSREYSNSSAIGSA